MSIARCSVCRSDANVSLSRRLAAGEEARREGGFGSGWRVGLGCNGDEPPDELKAAAAAEVAQGQGERVGEVGLRACFVGQRGVLLPRRRRARGHGDRQQAARVPRFLLGLAQRRFVARLAAVAAALGQQPLVALAVVEQTGPVQRLGEDDDAGALDEPFGRQLAGSTRRRGLQY